RQRRPIFANPSSALSCAPHRPPTPTRAPTHPPLASLAPPPERANERQPTAGDAEQRPAAPASAALRQKSRVHTCPHPPHLPLASRHDLHPARGHPQPATPIHIDTTTTVGIVNNTIKRMWLLDKAAQDMFKFQHHPGQENLGDYPSKHHSGDIHQHVPPFYVHMDDSPHFLPRASLRYRALGEGVLKL
ncbi:hypothetical protein THAOC_09351, partial [Thalassiosira oceanica]